MIQRDPEGYRKLLAYQKAVVLQQDTNKLVTHLPRSYTFLDLADQMARSGRSGSKNIVEGWKRNTTKEYFDFLGFSIGAVSELMEDAADIATGVYPMLLGVKGIMGTRGAMSRQMLDELRYYPLPSNVSPCIMVFLKAKEVNYLLYRLQQSLDLKMDRELTKPIKDRFVERQRELKAADAWLKQLQISHGWTYVDGEFLPPDVAKRILDRKSKWANENGNDLEEKESE
jgi:four helix bundle protein